MAELPLEPCCSPTSQLSEPSSVPTPPCLCPRRMCRPRENKPTPSHGWSLAFCMRQRHNSLLDSLQLQPMLSDSLSLSFQGLRPQPTPPSIPASQPHSSSPGTSAELRRRRPRLQVLVSALRTRLRRDFENWKYPQSGALGLWQPSHMPQSSACDVLEGSVLSCPGHRDPCS